MSSHTDLAPAPPGGWLDEAPRLPIPSAGGGIRNREAVLSWLIYRVAKFDAANLFRLLATHLRLFFPWLALAARLNPYGSLPRTDTELVVLRVAWNCRCRYEWAQHVTLARGAGVTAEEIERVPLGSGADGWSPLRSALMDAADELHGGARMSDATWERLAAHYDRRQMVELCMLVGSYEMLAGVVNSAGVPVDARVEQRRAAITRIGG